MKRKIICNNRWTEPDRVVSFAPDFKDTIAINIKDSKTKGAEYLFESSWMKKQGIDDALIQPYSGHESRKSLEIYSKLSITEVQVKDNRINSRLHHSILDDKSLCVKAAINKCSFTAD